MLGINDGLKIAKLMTNSKNSEKFQINLGSIFLWLSHLALGTDGILKIVQLG